MKKLLLAGNMVFLALQISFAQEPDESLRTAWFTQNGTARSIAVGGAIASLGGDITAAHVNPAGIGLYKTHEFVYTPSINFNNNKINYRGTDSSAKKSCYMGGTAGFIFGGTPRYSSSTWSSYAFAVTYNQLANFNNHISYSGFNNYSSFTEKYLEELARDGADTTAALYNYSYGASLAFWTYLITDTTINGQLGYKSLVPVPSTTSGIYQYYDATTTGGYNEVAFSFAGNKGDNLYLGASITIPFVDYSRNFTYTEKDASGNTNNNFSYFTYKESLTSSGIGVGLKLGMIAKAGDCFRIGAAVHSPQFISFEDKIHSSIIANTEGYAGTRTETSDGLTDNTPGKREYNLLTPWRAIAGVSYVVTDIEDTKQQKGFISADVEYVNYKGSRYYATDKSDNALVNYYKSVNDEIKNYYKGNVNVKVGGELKFDPIMVRAGFAYYGSPYADNNNLKANKTIVSGGVGYRKYGIFVDLTYAYSMGKDVNFPYRLNDVANTYANVKNHVGNLTLTFGVKF